MFAMSRSVAGFTLILYVCVVSGQEYPVIRLKGRPDDPSIAIGVISGGNYPPGSFSIGYGDNNENGDERPGVVHGGNAHSPTSGPVTSGQNDNGYIHGQDNGGYVHGQNDINNYGGQNGVGQNGGPLQNPGQKPTHPYDDNYNGQNSTPVKNSANRNSLFSKIFSFLFSWINF